MADTPKAENKTGDTVSAAVGADTISQATATSLPGAAAGTDTLAGGSEQGSDSLSGAAASGVYDGAAGQDSLAGTTAAATTSPWAASSDTIAASESDAETLGTDAQDRKTEDVTSRPSRAEASSSGGGFGKVVIAIIVIVLIGGVGYATYPEWRDEAVPYAEMIGVTLPPAPTETDPDAAPQTDTAAAPDSAAPDSTNPGGTSAPAPTVPDAASGSNGASSTGSAAVSAEEFETLTARVAELEAAVSRLSDQPASAPATGSSAADATAGERISALESRLTALTDEMAIVRQGLGTAEDTDGITSVASDLSDRLNSLDSRLSDLETKAETPAVAPGDLTALSERIESLKSTSEAGDSDIAARIDALAATQNDLADKLAQGRNKQEQAGAFLLATNLLSASTADSGPFTAELDAVETAALDQPEIGQAIGDLRAHVEGVPSVADLRARFPTVAASIIDASIVGADDDMVGTALTRIASLVTLRRTETDAGNEIDAIVNRAEAAANAGDLPAAVSSLEELDGDPAKVAEPWIAGAKARIAVDRSVRVLQSRALATLSGG